MCYAADDSPRRMILSALPQRYGAPRSLAPPSSHGATSLARSFSLRGEAAQREGGVNAPDPSFPSPPLPPQPLAGALFPRFAQRARVHASGVLCSPAPSATHECL